MFGSLNDFEGGLFDDMQRLQREMDSLLGTGRWPAGIRAVARGTYPPINVGSTAERVDVYVFAAGFDQERFDISIQQNLLTIEGERQLIREEGADYYSKERQQGSFRRVITLPEDVDPDEVEALYRDGILHIAIKRRQPAQARQIPVK
jgi:HSP20 family protein